MNKDSNTKRVGIFTVHSQKGGVGKTSLAVAIATLEAVFNNKKILIIDADLTGTSLLDVLPIDAGNSKINYFNDLIMASPPEFDRCTSVLFRKQSSKFATFCYKVKELPNIFVMPGSPLFDDISRVVPLISQEDSLHFFRHRIEDIIITAINDGYEAIIIDHPPGLYGLSLSSLRMTIEHQVNSYKEVIKNRLGLICGACFKDTVIEASSILITTADNADHTACIPSFLNVLSDSTDNDEEVSTILNHHYLFINKGGTYNGGIFDSALVMGDIFDNVDACGKDRCDDTTLIPILRKRVEKMGASACGHIDSFDITKITSYVKGLKVLKEKKPMEPIKAGSTQDWCEQVRKAVDIRDA